MVRRKDRWRIEFTSAKVSTKEPRHLRRDGNWSLRAVYQHRHRFKVLHHVVLERVNSRIEDELICRAYGDRVTVRRCARYTSNGDAAARTSDVFNHHHLRKHPPHGFGQHARERIKEATRRIGYDHRDGTRWMRRTQSTPELRAAQR
jgi:hypothetical protein